MKIPVLIDLHNEINRLFIAGAKFAAQDPRIGKHLPVIAKMGERAPAIKKLADMTQKLLVTSEPENALADLGVYLNSILSTQGDTASSNMTEADHKPFFKALPQTVAPYSALTPIVAALSKSGPSRLEILEEAFKVGRFNDFRLYAHLSKGLGDKHAPIVEYLSETVIPSLGAVMVPFLLRDLDINGGRVDARRLALLDVLGYENTQSLAESAVTDGSEEVLLEALPILGKNSAHEELLLAMADDRRSSVKEAALVGLAIMNSPAGKEKMLKILSSGKFKPAIKAAARCTDLEYNSKVFELIKRHCDELAATGEKGVKHFTEILPALNTKDDDYVLDFLKSLFTDAKIPFADAKIASALLMDILSAANNVLLSLPNISALSVYEQIADTEAFQMKLDQAYYSNFTISYLIKARSVYSPGRLFEVFELAYKKHKMFSYYFAGVELDPRWLKAFIGNEDIGGMELLLNTDARERVLKYLTQYVRKKNRDNYRHTEAVKLLKRHLPPDELAQLEREESIT